jgi:hypothetical protein
VPYRRIIGASGSLYVIDQRSGGEPSPHESRTSEGGDRSRPLASCCFYGGLDGI